MVCVGIAEEFWFRSYLQQTLWKSIGFWPSASVIALIFAAEHYFFKAGENIWDVITLRFAKPAVELQHAADRHAMVCS